LLQPVGGSDQYWAIILSPAPAASLGRGGGEVSSQPGKLAQVLMLETCMGKVMGYFFGRRDFLELFHGFRHFSMQIQFGQNRFRLYSSRFINHYCPVIGRCVVWDSDFIFKKHC
jgi:hypothetical protein